MVGIVGQIVTCDVIEFSIRLLIRVNLIRRLIFKTWHVYQYIPGERKFVSVLLSCNELHRNSCLFFFIVEKTAGCFTVQDVLGLEEQ